jgi:rhamnose transport system substrate-binding protein
MNGKRKILLAFVLVIVMAFVFSGCGSGGDAATEEPPATEEDTSASDDADVAEETSGDDSAAEATSSDSEKAPDGYKIVFIPKNMGNPYFDALSKGFEQASGELGFEYEYLGPADATATSQIEFIKTQIQRGVNAIVVSPNSADALDEVYTEARDAGIQMINVNNDMEENEQYRDACILPCDHGILGGLEVEAMSKLLNGEGGQIAILTSTTDSPDQLAWIAQMEEALAQPEYSNMELVEIAYGNDDPQKSLTETEALVTKYPDLKGIIAPTTVAIAAAAQALETAGVGGKIQLTGFGTPNEMRSFVKSGTCKEFILWDPFEQGYLASYLAVGVSNGTIKYEEGQTFSAPGLENRVMGPDCRVLANDPIVFNAENIDNFDF